MLCELNQTLPNLRVAVATNPSLKWTKITFLDVPCLVAESLGPGGWQN